jgi:D-sedoheptulose 7-phosphate isomerase
MKGSQYKLEAIGDIVRENLLVMQAILADHQLLETVASIGEKMVLALKDGKKLFFFGNGGSAADAQHLAAEFVGRFNRQRRALPAIALTTDTSVLTSISNDYSYESVFARQLEGLGSPGDIAVGISTSGSSPNVLSGIRVAKDVGLIAVGMTGLSGKELLELSDYCVRVPSDHAPRIQEAHILIGHILCEMVDEGLAGSHGELN